MYFSAITATFAAAHALRNYQGKCERLHGHNWKIEVLTGTERLDEAGMGLDFTCCASGSGRCSRTSTTASSEPASPGRPRREARATVAAPRT